MKEDDFIGMVKKKFEGQESNEFLGIGDDCAVIPGRGELLYLLTTDSLVEGVHFIKEFSVPRQLGDKLMSVNLSDVAAMGGMGKYALLSVCLPQGVESEWLGSFIDGVTDMCAEHGVALVGGNTTRSMRDFSFSLTMVGEVERGNLKLRSGARTGDLIVVNSVLGDSAAGCRLLREGVMGSCGEDYLIRRHNVPRALVQEGVWLGKEKGVSAMMDLSDGLSQDLKRLLKASGCGGVVNVRSVPVSEELSKVVSERKWGDARRVAVVGGEDYGLLFTVQEKCWEDLSARYRGEFGVPLYVLGKINEDVGRLMFFDGEDEVNLEGEGFSHF